MSTTLDLIAQHLEPSPEDFVAARVHRLLSHDTALVNVLGDNIILLKNPEDMDRTIVDRQAVLRVAPFLTSEPDEQPNKREERPVEVLIGLIWEDLEGWAPVHPGRHPSSTNTSPGTGYGTILSHCWAVASKPGNRALVETNQSGVEIQTVLPGPTNRSAFPFTPEPNPESGAYVYGMALSLRYRVKIDVRTGKIEGL